MMKLRHTLTLAIATGALVSLPALAEAGDNKRSSVRAERGVALAGGFRGARVNDSGLYRGRRVDRSHRDQRRRGTWNRGRDRHDLNRHDLNRYPSPRRVAPRCTHRGCSSGRHVRGCAHYVAPPTYRRVWVPPVYRTILIGYNDCGRPIYDRVIITRGYYRRVHVGY